MSFLKNVSTKLVDKFNSVKNFFSPSLITPETFIEKNSQKSYDYSTPNLSTSDKIVLEQRRRYQAYMALDYLLDLTSYFDFFSESAINIVQKSKEYSQLLSKTSVSSDIFLAAFFEENSEVASLLEKYGIKKTKVNISISELNPIEPKNLGVKILSSIKNFLLYIDIPLISEKLVVAKDIKFSGEMNQIFEKAADNAMNRFRTPVISSEILLITIMELEKTKGGKILNSFLKTKQNWYTLRYALIKRLHSQELAIRTQVKKNQQYFAYLLKAQLSEEQFENIIKNKYLPIAVSYFRDNLISEILEIDLMDKLKRDIYTSHRLTSKRKYS